jgi:NADH:ubiquinone oxidoreductase subunit 2 (subunit N)
MRESTTDATGKISTAVVLWLAGAFTLVLGVLPSVVMDWARSWGVVGF